MIHIENEIFAKDITDCDSCPIYKADCPGGYTSGGGGQPIEPPCCSWDDDTKVYVGMYSYERDYSPQEIAWCEERSKAKEEAERVARHKADVEEAMCRVREITGGGNTPRRYGGEFCATWYCKRCNRWVYSGVESSSGGITTSYCPRCGDSFAHAWILDEE